MTVVCETPRRLPREQGVVCPKLVSEIAVSLPPPSVGLWDDLWCSSAYTLSPPTIRISGASLRRSSRGLCSLLWRHHVWVAAGSPAVEARA